MADVSVYARSFASPDGGDGAAIARALAAGRLNSSRRMIATALAGSPHEKAADALLAFEWGNGHPWRPETGLALLAHRNGSTGLAVLQLGAACAGTGGSGWVEVLLEEPAWLYLDGWLVGVGGRCSVGSDGRAITVDSDFGPIAAFELRERRWVPTTPATGPWIAYGTGGLAPRYAAVSGLRHSIEGFPWIAGPPSLTAIEPPNPVDSRIETIRQGWQVILEHAPVYGPWVASTATGCLVLDRSGEQVAQSGSSFDHPGLIAIEPPDCPVFCGELFVHECSHQQLLIYGMIAPTVVAGSHERHYSPIKRADRTVEQVLIAAHAVGNMILYYGALRRTMQLDRRSWERFEQHRTWFAEDYRRVLDRSESLTPAGRALWDGVCQAVDTSLRQ